MKASELRIGNLVQVEFATNVVSVICINDLQTHQIWVHDHKHPATGYNEEEIHPIPLTHEWLIRFGFVNGYRDGALVKWDIPSSYGGGILYYVDKTFLIDCDGGDIGIEIKYVHQLQNLYFALTGEELEFNIMNKTRENVQDSEQMNG